MFHQDQLCPAILFSNCFFFGRGKFPENRTSSLSTPRILDLQFFYSVLLISYNKYQMISFVSMNKIVYKIKSLNDITKCNNVFFLT